MISRKGQIIKRILMIGFTVLDIMFGCLALYKHVIEGLAFVFIGVGGLIYFSYRLGKTSYGEDDDMKNIMDNQPKEKSVSHE